MNDRRSLKDRALDKVKGKPAPKNETVSQMKERLNNPQDKEQFVSETGFAERNRQDQERFALAVETEYWFAICFMAEHQKRAFLEKTGWGNLYGHWQGQTFVNHAAPGKPQALKPQRRLFSMQRRIPVSWSKRDGGVPNPLSEVAYTGDAEQDPLNEMSALLSACESRNTEPITTFWASTSSPFYIPVVFQCVAHKEAFLSHVNWIKHGDKYIDGLWLADIWGLTLPEAEYPIPAPEPPTEDYINGYWLSTLYDLHQDFVHLSNKDAKPDPVWMQFTDN